MNFDTFSTAAIATEARERILNGRVQRVTQINSLTYGLEIYVHPFRHYLLLGVEPQAPRLYLTLEKVRRGVGHDTPLMLTLRKYMRGAFLRRIEQPPYERILYFHFESPTGPTILVAEMLGTRSNLILIEADHTILGAARLSKQSDKRPILPNFPYEPPPPLRKLDPAELTEFQLRQEIQESSPDLRLYRLLPGIVNGVSPLLAREITYRATGAVDTPVGQVEKITPLLEAFQTLFDIYWSEQWQPVLAFDEEGEAAAFAPYPLGYMADNRPTDSFSAAIEAYYIEVAAGYARAKLPLREAIQEARDKLARRRERLAEDAAAQPDPLLLKEKGEAILAYAHQIEPGQPELTVEWGFTHAPFTAELDPALDPPENAQQYFDRYRKALRAGNKIPVQFEQIAVEENYLDQLEQDIEMAEDRTEIDIVTGLLAEAGYYRPKRKPKQTKKSGGPYLRLQAPDGATIWVGKNAAQNAYLTFNRASPDDLWLHARDVPGAHTIIPTAEGLPSEADVLWAAGVTAYYSRARHDTAVEVAVTLKKYVRSIKGGPPGLVTYRNESTLNVAPIAPNGEE